MLVVNRESSLVCEVSRGSLSSRIVIPAKRESFSL